MLEQESIISAGMSSLGSTPDTAQRGGPGPGLGTDLDTVLGLPETLLPWG